MDETKFILRLVKGISASWIVVLLACIAYLVQYAGAVPAPHILMPRTETVSWTNPCGVSLTEDIDLRIDGDVPKRHILGTVKKILNKTILEFCETHGCRRAKKTVRHYCNETSIEIKTFDNVCTKSLLKFRQYLAADPDRPRKELTYTWLSNFHDCLLSYQSSVNKIVNLDVLSYGADFDPEKRKKMLNQTEAMMNSLLCEVETAINSSFVPLTYNTKREVPKLLRKFPVSNTIDVTSMCALDEGFYVLFENFLNHWKKILNQISDSKRHNRSAKKLRHAAKQKKKAQRMVENKRRRKHHLD